MSRRHALGVLVLCLVLASPSRARELPGADLGSWMPQLSVEIDVGRIDLMDAPSLSARGVDAVKVLANLPARAAHGLGTLARRWRETPRPTTAWSWAKFGLLEPLVRLRASQTEAARGSSEVEVETARSTVGEAVGWSPGEFGWAVRTWEHVLIVAEDSEQRAAEMPTLWINRGIRDRSGEQSVAVFTSSPCSLGESDEVPGLPRADAGDGMEITAYRSEESRVSFLVRISGPVVLHAAAGDA